MFPQVMPIYLHRHLHAMTKNEKARKKRGIDDKRTKDEWREKREKRTWKR